MVRGKGDLLIIGESFYDRPETQRILDDLEARADPPWGLSLCTNMDYLEEEGLVLSKKITHVGVTRNPEFGPENTYIHYWSRDWRAIDRELQRFMEREPDLYVPAPTRERLQARALAWEAAAAKPQLPVLHTTMATRDATSDSTSHLLLPTGAATRALPAPDSSSSSSRMADSSTAPSTPGTGGTPATPSTPSGQQQVDPAIVAATFGRLHQEVHDKFETPMLATANGASSTDDMYTAENFELAQSYMRRYTDALTQYGLGPDVSQWPRDTWEHLDVLNKFMNNARDFGNEFGINKVYGKDSNAVSAVQSRYALANSAQSENLPRLREVFATANSFSKNHRELAAQMLAKQTEVEARKMELETLKRSRDEWEAQRKKFEEEAVSAKAAAEEAVKRARIEALTPPAAALSKPGPQAIDATATGRGLAAISGSNNDMAMPGLPNVRIGKPVGAWFSNMAKHNTDNFDRNAAGVYARDEATLRTTNSLAEIMKSQRRPPLTVDVKIKPQ
jgi:hypothetical protein